MLASADAVHASHAAAVVDFVLLCVDARSLAVARAQGAAVALGYVNHRLEP